VSWPPKIGELLPRADDAYNVHEKLRDYSLNARHKDGGEKAAGFRQILGITAENLDYLATVLLDGAVTLPVSVVRENQPFGLNCNIVIPVRGVGEYADRVAPVLTSWELRYEGDRPRLVTAYIDQ
jgi:hypothetical protein